MRTAKEVLNDFWTGEGESDVITAMLQYVDERQVPTKEKLKIAIKALKEISEGKGAYSRDPLKHAENVIEESKALAVGALKEMGYE